MELMLAEETEVFGENLPPLPYVTFNIPHEINWDRTLTATVRSRLFTASTVAPSAGEFSKLGVKVPVVISVRSKEPNAFDNSNTGILGSNSTRGMNICPLSAFVLLCVSSILESG
jgi:hypothetical protein